MRLPILTALQLLKTTVWCAWPTGRTGEYSVLHLMVYLSNNCTQKSSMADCLQSVIVPLRVGDIVYTVSLGKLETI